MEYNNLNYHEFLVNLHSYINKKDFNKIVFRVRYRNSYNISSPNKRIFPLLQFINSNKQTFFIYFNNTDLMKNIDCRDESKIK